MTPTEHSSELTDKKPIYLKLRRLPQLMDYIVNAEIDKLLEGNVIKQCFSPWAFTAVIFHKPDRISRFCVDFNVLNVQMKADRFTLPNM